MDNDFIPLGEDEFEGLIMFHESFVRERLDQLFSELFKKIADCEFCKCCEDHRRMARERMRNFRLRQKESLK